jgi:hypothetical protein
MPTPLPRALAAVLLVATIGGCGDEDPPPRDAASRARTPATDRLGPYPRSEFFLAHDRFLAADDPRTVPAAQAAFLRDDDEVFGIVVAERARAYAISMLAYHHVVNDVVAGTPVAVTY